MPKLINNYLDELESINPVDFVESKNKNTCPSVSVIIVTYRCELVLIENLKALENQTFSNFEIIIVDNNEKNGLYTKVKDYCSKYIKLKKNYGLSCGRNVGIKYADSEITVFLDDDAIPRNDFVESHKKAYELNDIVGLRGRCFPRTKAVFNELAEHYDLGNETLDYYINLEGNSSFKKKFLNDIGGFNNKLEGAGGHEGLEITYRGVKSLGSYSKFIYFPDAVIYHDFSNGFSKYVKKQFRHKHNFQNLQKNYPEIFEFSENYKKVIFKKKRSLFAKLLKKITTLALKIIP